MFDELGELPHGPPEDDVHVESKSRDTIGNAIYAKVGILKPDGFTAANLVTADYHIKRAATIFERVLSNDFQITPVETKSNYSLGELKVLHRKEILYSMIAKAVMLSYDPEKDDERLKSRVGSMAKAN